MSVMFVRAIFDYDAQEDTELTMREGDIIEVLADDASGWWRGLLDGQEGVFPSNFTEPYEEEGEPEKDIPAQQKGMGPVNPVAGVSMSELNSAMNKRANAVVKEEPKKEEPKKAAAGVKTVGKAAGAKVAAAPAAAPAAAAPAAAATAASGGGGGGGGKKEMVVARHDYLGAQEDDELSFAGDDVITVLKKDNSGWWQGELRDQVGWFPSTFVRPLTKEEETALLGEEDTPAPAPVTKAAGAATKKAAGAKETAPAVKAVAKTAAATTTAAAAGAGAAKTPGAAAAAPIAKTAAAPAATAAKAAGGLSKSVKSAEAVAAKEVSGAVSAAAAVAAPSNPSGWPFSADFDKVASTLTAAWSKACAGAKAGRDGSAAIEGRPLSPALVIYAGPSHCASDGAEGQQVSLQEAAAGLLQCADLRAAADDGPNRLASLLSANPSLVVSHNALEAGRRGCASAYALAATLPAPLDEALNATLSLRACSGSLRGIAAAFLAAGDGSWLASNGLCVWVLKGRLAVVAVHPAVDKEVSVAGKAFGAEVAKIK